MQIVQFNHFFRQTALITDRSHVHVVD